MQVLADQVSLQVQAKFGKLFEPKKKKTQKNFEAFCPEFQNEISCLFFLVQWFCLETKL